MDRALSGAFAPPYLHIDEEIEICPLKTYGLPISITSSVDFQPRFLAQLTVSGVMSIGSELVFGT